VFPKDEGSWSHDLEYMVGPSLLSAPVTETTDSPSVYLPPGEWIDLYNGDIVAGPVQYQRKTSLEEFPLYLRRGSAIPFNWREPDIWATPWKTNDLARKDRAGWLYAPKDGARYDVRASGPYSGNFQGSRRGSQVRFTLSGAPREAQVAVTAAGIPAQVFIDGRRIPQATDLRGVAQGWTIHNGAIVVKLAPGRGRSDVRIELSAEPKVGSSEGGVLD
jgi:alpha-D-xyloside xylohydrolase